MKNKEQRVGIFIDVQNLYHSAKNLYKARVNFKELVKQLTAGRKLIRAIAYVVKTDNTEGESAFFDALKQAGIELRMKDIQINAGGSKKADWDVGMAVDAIRMSGFLDVVVLVTGDGDFLPLVDYLKWGAGRVVEVSAFSRTTKAEMKTQADEFVPIEDLRGVLIRGAIGRMNNRRAASGNTDDGGGETE